jgi:hypothetical protein
MPGQPEDPTLISPIDRISNDSPETSFKLLGVLIDEYLSFNDHISHVCAKISKSLFCINRIKNFVNKNALVMLYYTMVHSHLSYCLNIYGSANSTNLQRLRIKQKEAVRAICNLGYREHTYPLFKNLKILPLNEMIKYANLKFMHSYINNKLPFTFNETWVFNRDRNTV